MVAARALILVSKENCHFCERTHDVLADVASLVGDGRVVRASGASRVDRSHSHAPGFREGPPESRHGGPSARDVDLVCTR